MDSGQSAYSYSYLTRLIKGFTKIKQEFVIFRILERLRRFGLVLILSSRNEVFYNDLRSEIAVFVSGVWWL